MLREDIENMKKDVQNMHKEVAEENTLATSLLHELKQTSKRNFIAFIITLIALVGTNVAWLIYESSFDTVYEDSTQYMEDIDNTSNTNFTQHID